MPNRYNPKIHHRRSIRLQGYDYSRAGAYFVTICTHVRECLFGEIADGVMGLNPLGQIVQNHWHDLPNHYKNIQLNEFVIMPNHVHGIIVITKSPVGAGLKPAPTENSNYHGLSEIIRGFKTFSANRINQTRKTPGISVWQRNYHEHIIRDDEDLNRIREYIAANPLRWTEDENHPRRGDAC